MANDQILALAETYRSAAAERMASAIELYEKRRFVEANYLAGLAVECVLRGYRVRMDPKFDARHDVDRLYKLARFGDIVPRHEVQQVGGAIGDVVALWSNDHRYLSEAALRKRWVKRGLFRGIRGDFLKERTRQLLNSAQKIVNIGVVRWTHS